MKKRFNKQLIIPAILAVAIYELAYFIPKFLVNPSRYHFLMFAIDSNIKLFPPAILIYIFSYLQWANGILIIAMQDKKIGYKALNTIIIGSLIGFVIFMVYPTAVIRPEVTGNGILYSLIRIIYYFDSIQNSMPSFHCFFSTAIVIALMNIKGLNKKTVVFNIVLSILIFASTVLTKQHFIIDIPTGVLLAIISYYLSNYIKFDKIFDKLSK